MTKIGMTKLKNLLKLYYIEEAGAPDMSAAVRDLMTDLYRLAEGTEIDIAERLVSAFEVYEEEKSEMEPGITLPSLQETIMKIPLIITSENILKGPQFYAKYKSRNPDPGVCLIVSIDWEDKSLSMTNGSCRYHPSFDEIEIVERSKS